MTKKRVLVSGGAGFLGSHLCERLLAQNAHVLCLDNFLSGSEKNVAHLISNPAFELLEHDVTQPIDIRADEIYNLACPASPIHYQQDPIRTTRTAVLGAIAMLELANKNGAKILQASTSEVYGDPRVHPQTEDYWGNVNPVGVRACYDEGKRCAETLFFDYRRKQGVRIKVARIFNTYGPRMLPQDGRVVSNFILQALNHSDVTLYGDGSQTRSFCFVDDLVGGLLAAMLSSDAFCGPVNLGNPVEFRIADLAKKIIELTGSRSKLVFKALPEDDPARRCPDISLAKKELAWSPKISLDEGLRKTIEYFRSL